MQKSMNKEFKERLKKQEEDEKAYQKKMKLLKKQANKAEAAWNVRKERNEKIFKDQMKK